jgi:hypothetical protein
MPNEDGEQNAFGTELKTEQFLFLKYYLCVLYFRLLLLIRKVKVLHVRFSPQPSLGAVTLMSEFKFNVT